MVVLVGGGVDLNVWFSVQCQSGQSQSNNRHKEKTQITKVARSNHPKGVGWSRRGSLKTFTWPNLQLPKRSSAQRHRTSTCLPNYPIIHHRDDTDIAFVTVNISDIKSKTTREQKDTSRSKYYCIYSCSRVTVLTIRIQNIYYWYSVVHFRCWGYIICIHHDHVHIIYKYIYAYIIYHYI